MGTFESITRTSWERGREYFGAIHDRARRLNGWEWAGVALCVVVALSLIPLLVALITIVLLVALLFVWVAEFVTLMRLPEDVFPGHRDKLVWMLFMLLVPPVGLLAFWTFRRSHWPDGVPVPPPYTQKPKSPWSEDELS
jgi:small-conductance mechanosensitive channel